MASNQPTQAERDAAERSTRAQTAIRTWGRMIDLTVTELAATVGELAADQAEVAALVGSDSTRPQYTEDLQRFHRQRERLQLLLDTVKDGRL